MGLNASMQKVNFEDVKQIIKSPQWTVINTLPIDEQICLLPSTTAASREEDIVNNLLRNKDMQRHILIYGKNGHEESVFNKYAQLTQLGFLHVYIYPGGMFEWLLLQDIYGTEEFPTTSKELDIIRYAPKSSFATTSR